MVKIADKPAGTMLVEFLGPEVDRNYFSGGPTEVHLQVFGAGEVTLQETDVFIFKGENVSSTPPKHVKRVASTDPADWANVAGAVDIAATDGLTTVTIASGTDLRFLRLIVGATTGDGKAVVASDWN